jgi:dihydroorotase
MLIKNCKIVSSDGVVEADILIEGEKIVRIGKTLQGDGEVIDAAGSVVIPGVVDAHVHMRDFKEAHKEDFTSGSMAALAGGVTTFLEMPNTSPSITDVSTLGRRIKTGEKGSLADFGTHLGFSDKTDELQGISAPSVKIYLDSLNESVEETLENAFSRYPFLTLHCEDPRIIRRNMEFADDARDFLLHADIREAEAETSAVKMATRLSLKHEKRAHICHITLPKTVTLLNKYTTCEITPHHLLLTEKDLRELKGIAKTNPPLRTKLDIHGLWQALKRAKIQVIASDHAPHTLEEKERDVLSCPSGIPNLEVMLRLMLDIVNRGTLQLTDIVRMMCENPARIFRVKNKGFIKTGADADLVILDMDAESKIDSSEFYSKATYSPFDGRKTKGGVKTVILRGKVAYEDRVFPIKPGYGRYLY